MNTIKIFSLIFPQYVGKGFAQDSTIKVRGALKADNSFLLGKLITKNSVVPVTESILYFRRQSGLKQRVF